MNREERIGFNELLQNKFTEERKKWTVYLEPILKKVNKDPNELSEAQSYMLKYRHDLTEEISMLLSDIAKEQRTIKELKKERLENYLSGGSQLRLQQKGERDIAIAGDLALMEETNNYLEAHLDFLKECRNTMDKMGYAVTNRIEIYKLIMQ